MLPNIVYLIPYDGGWGVYRMDAEHPDDSLCWGTYEGVLAWLRTYGYHHKERNIYAKVD